MKFEGKIEWDKTKPKGQPRRRVSNKRAKEFFEFKPELAKTDEIKIDLFEEEYRYMWINHH